MEPRKPGNSALIVLSLLLCCIAACRRDKHPKVLVIGVDGATFELVRPWMDEGKLPNFARLVKEGASGELRSTIPPLSGTAWTTAVTGVNPGKHGIFGFTKGVRWEGERPKAVVFYSGRDRRVPAVWQLLSRNGLPVVVMNVPCTSPPDEVNGYMVSGFPHVSREQWTFPHEFKKEIEDWPVDFDTGVRYTEGLGYAREKTQEAENQAEVLLRLMKKKKWRLFWIVFTITDRVQHRYWRYIDKEHPLHPENPERECVDAIFKSYATMDAILGRVLKRIDGSTTVIIISDHGFGTSRYVVNGNTFLRRHCRTAKVAVTPGHIEWGTFNVDPVGPGPYDKEILAEVERVKEDLVDKLRQLRHPGTGKLVVEEVFTREQVYDGPCVHEAPSVITSPAPGYMIFNAVAPGEEEGDQWTMWNKVYSGYHRPNGVLIMRGPGIRPNATVAGASLQDITPTILYLLGQQVPGYMDGDVLVDAVQPQHLKRHPPARKPQANGDPESRRKLIEDQLRSVGYIK